MRLGFAIDPRARAIGETRLSLQMIQQHIGFVQQRRLNSSMKFASWRYREQKPSTTVLSD